MWDFLVACRAGWGAGHRLHGFMLLVCVGLAWAVAGVPASGKPTGSAEDTFAELMPILQRSCGA
jgi:hypothetical protein